MRGLRICACERAWDLPHSPQNMGQVVPPHNTSRLAQALPETSGRVPARTSDHSPRHGRRRRSRFRVVRLNTTRRIRHPAPPRLDHLRRRAHHSPTNLRPPALTTITTRRCGYYRMGDCESHAASSLLLRLRSRYDDDRTSRRTRATPAHVISSRLSWPSAILRRKARCTSQATSSRTRSRTCNKMKRHYSSPGRSATGTLRCARTSAGCATAWSAPFTGYTRRTDTSATWERTCALRAGRLLARERAPRPRLLSRPRLRSFPACPQSCSLHVMCPRFPRAPPLIVSPLSHACPLLCSFRSPRSDLPHAPLLISLRPIRILHATLHISIYIPRTLHTSFVRRTRTRIRI